MDFLSEATKIVDAAKEKNVDMRIMGAVAFMIHCPNYLHIHRKLQRELTDVDFMSNFKKVSALIDLLKSLGYTLKWGSLTDRKIFSHPNHKLTIDVFFDELRMCHVINFRKRLTIDYPTISLADLLLEKLQIVKINEKDIKDVIVLLREHQIGASDKETINAQYIAKLFSNDWCFYYTATTNLQMIRDRLATYDALEHKDIENVSEKIGALLAKIENEPKNFGWKMRAKVGTRRKWYTEVEDVIR